MAPIDFENNIKDKLDERMLKPSTDAWGKLSNRLANQDKKNNKKPYWWLGLAASIVGVLFVVSPFLNNDTKVNDAPKIVNTPEVIQQSKTNRVVVDNDEVIDNVEDVQVKAKRETIQKVEAQKLVNTKKEQELVASVIERTIVSKEKTNSVATAELPKKHMTFEKQKIQDVIAQVQNMQDKNIVITDADIEVLLQEAQKEISYGPRPSQDHRHLCDNRRDPHAIDVAPPARYARSDCPKRN